jgi:tetratricopeptide (TPR) repeat protein
MLWDNLRLLAQLYVKPVQALGRILDDASLIFGMGAVLAVSFLSTLTVALPMYANIQAQFGRPPDAGASPSGEPATGPPEASGSLSDGQPATPRGMAAQLLGSFVTTSVFGALFGLAALYVPACLLVATLVAPVGSFGVAFRRDYGPLLVCALFSWAAAHLPFALLGLGLGAAGETSLSWTVGAWLAGTLAFGALMVLSLRTVFGLGFGAAAATAGLGVMSFALLPIAPLLASPFLLYWGWQYFRGDVSDIQWSFARRQGFKRHLQAATLNPRDSEAHYQLGLIYQQRRQLAEAKERFLKAVEIDRGEVDAHYQLGRIARSERRFPEAILHFEEVVRRDPTHSRHEVWREIGATYAESGDNEHARWSLEKYVAQRPHDPEGLCRMGEALEATSDREAARDHLRRAIEAADTMPPFRRREAAEWKRRAKRRLP